MSKRLHDQLALLATEQINPISAALDTMTMHELLDVINREDAKIAAAVAVEIPKIEKAVDLVVRAFRKGGRLIYIGAGTSGRLGILDAAECPPTFGTAPEMVVGVIAGGRDAVFRSQEGAEDKEANGARALRALRPKPNDVVCGIAASARTPFVIGAIKHAKTAGAKTIFVTTNPRTTLRTLGVSVDVSVCPTVGPEVIMGSTRMKSGTAQKFVLNMISTAAMVRLGKVYGNLMVDLQATNRKLAERSKRIVSLATGADYHASTAALHRAGGSVKTAIVMLRAGIDADEARRRLERAGGFVRKALECA